MNNVKRGRRAKIMFFLVYVIFAVYFLNFKFPILDVPSFILKINDWIISLGGVLLLLASFRQLAKRRSAS